MEDCAGSLQVETIRIAKLAPDGSPLAGAENLIITDSLISLGADPQYTEGEDLELKNGKGSACVAYKDTDKLKRINLALLLCTPDPWLHQFLSGGELIEDAGEVIGWAAPEIGEDPNPDGISIEAWTKAIVDGHQADTLPWIRWVYPRTYFNFGARNLANEIMQVPFTGHSEQNDNWGDGPANDWPHVSGRSFAFARDEDVPTPTCGPGILVAS